MLALVGSASSFGPTASSTWVVSGGQNGGGVVTSTAVSGSTAYLGGNFTYVGPPTGSFVAADSAGALVSPWPAVGGNVYAVAPDGANGFFIGGEFSSVGTRHANNVAHIKSDGTLDTAWAGSTDGTVYALAVSGGTVYAGGDFDHAGRRGRKDEPRGVLRVDRRARDGVHRQRDGYRRGRLRARGVGLGAVRRRHLLDARRQQPRQPGRGRRGHGRGDRLDREHRRRRLRARRRRRRRLRRRELPARQRDHCRATTSRPSTPPPARPRTGIRLPTPRSTRSSTRARPSTRAAPSPRSATRPGTASPRSTPRTSGAPRAGTPTSHGQVYSLAVSGTTVYAGGLFGSVNGATARDNAAGFDATTGTATSFAPVVGGTVDALAVSGTNVGIGGEFRTAGAGGATAGPVPRSNLAAIDLTTGKATDLEPRRERHRRGARGLRARRSTPAAPSPSRTGSRASGSRPSRPPAPRRPGTRASTTARCSRSRSSARRSTPAARSRPTSVQQPARAAQPRRRVPGQRVGQRLRRPDRLEPESRTAPCSRSTRSARRSSSAAASRASRRPASTGGSSSAAEPARGGESPGDRRRRRPGTPTLNGSVLALTHVGTTVYAGGAFTTVNGNVARGGGAAFSASGTGTANDWNPEALLGPEPAGHRLRARRVRLDDVPGGVFARSEARGRDRRPLQPAVLPEPVGRGRLARRSACRTSAGPRPRTTSCCRSRSRRRGSSWAESSPRPASRRPARRSTPTSPRRPTGAASRSSARCPTHRRT